MGSIVERSKVDKDGKVRVEYRAHIRRKGYASKSKVFASKREAQRWIRNEDAESSMTKIATGKKSFGAVLDDFIALGGCHHARHYQLDFWRDQFQHASLDEIKHGDIAGAVLVLRQKPAQLPGGALATPARRLSNSTVNRFISTLSTVFSFAVEHGLIDDHPMKGGRVKKLRENDGRQRTLTAAEELRLMEAAKRSEWPMMWLYMRMLLTTAARRSEVNNLRWSDVRLEDKVAILERTKNGAARALPLVADVREALKAAMKIKPLHSDFVFFDPRKPDRPKNVESPWQACRKAAGLEGQGVVLHTTRHTAVTKLVKGGANLAQVAAVSGHKTLAMLKRYEHLAASDSVELAERLLSGNNPATTQTRGRK